MIDSLITKNWQKMLIQGKLNSGKSDLTFMILNQLLKQETQGNWMNRLLGNKEKVLLFTEKVDQVQLISNNLYDRINVVENISQKNYYEYLVKYHQWENVELLVIDYINLLNSQSHLMKDLLVFINKHQIKTIFIENTHKLLMADLKVQSEADCIIETTRGNHGLEILVKKEEGKDFLYPKTFWIDNEVIYSSKK